LCVEDLLLHLALHVAHREDPPLVWLWEMDRVVQLESDTLEWARFAEMARRVGVERTVAGVLTEVRSLFQTPISSEVLDSLGAGSDTVNRRLSQRLAEDPTLTEREGLAQLLAIAGWRRKARYLCALLLPTTDFMMQQYSLRNRLQLPWAYLRRAAYFTWQGAKGAHRLLAQKRSY
jgi:hypothetical protein